MTDVTRAAQRRQPHGRTLRLLVMCLALNSAGAAEPSASARSSEAAPQFALSTTFQAAERDQATGIYVFGTTRIRSWTATHYILMREGRGVQIHTKANGVWLPKLEGSNGGLLIGAAKFDQLSSIAGGLNRNAKELSPATRDRFFCLAGFGGCTSAARSHSESLSVDDPSGRRTTIFSLMRPGLLSLLMGAAEASESSCPRCQLYFKHGETAGALRLDFDATGPRILFEGWGIHAMWPVPPLDEI